MIPNDSNIYTRLNGPNKIKPFKCQQLRSFDAVCPIIKPKQQQQNNELVQQQNKYQELVKEK